MDWQHGLFNVLCVKALPDHWINGVIPPLLKGKDSKSELKNYRGVNLLSAPGKTFGKILTEFYKKIEQTLRCSV